MGEGGVAIDLGRTTMPFAEFVASIPESDWVVYVLRSIPRPMRTYVGVTNNLARRIRQHNGELAGGARATRTTRPWEMCGVVCGFGDDKSLAMRCEWFCKVGHYRDKTVPGGTGMRRRLFLVDHALSKCRDAGRELCVRFVEDIAGVIVDPDPAVVATDIKIVIDIA
jgi:predicted GIY-YIG superfamily endonuclease